MSEDYKQMPVKDFWELGLIQEINRKFLHPMGLALVMVKSKGTLGEPFYFMRIRDCRNDPEGIYFSDLDESDLKKAEAVKALFESKKDARIKELGYFIQGFTGKNGEEI